MRRSAITPLTTLLLLVLSLPSLLLAQYPGRRTARQPTGPSAIGPLGDAQNTAFQLTTPDVKLPPMPRWQQQLPAALTTAPVVVDSLVLIGCADGHFYALNHLTGAIAWQHATQGKPLCTPLVQHGVVYFTSTGGMLYALDLHTGTPRWFFDLEGEYSLQPSGAGRALPSPRLHEHRLLIPTPKGEVWALDTRSAERIWRFDAAAPIYMPVTVSGYLALVADSTGTLYALDALAGTVHWQEQLGAPITGHMALYRGSLFMGLHNGEALCLEARTGREVWRKALPEASFVDGPAVYSRRLYLSDAAQGQLFCFDTETGLRLWARRYHAGLTGPSLTGKYILLTGLDGHLRMLGLPDATGSERATWASSDARRRADGFFGTQGTLAAGIRAYYNYDNAAIDAALVKLGAMAAPPAVQEGRLYLTTRAGLVRCLE